MPTIVKLPSGRRVRADLIVDTEPLPGEPPQLLIMLDTAPVVRLGEALEELGLLEALRAAHRHISGEDRALSRAAVLAALEDALEGASTRLQDIISGPRAVLLDEPEDVAALGGYLDRHTTAIS